MNKTEFLIRLAEVLDYDGAIVPNQDVASIDEWDSLGILSVIELLNDMGMKIDPEKIIEVENISMLLQIVHPVLKD